ncbi:MAG: hypothetical protein ACYS9X_30220 [Planctomycetota bacterium]|jgi:hypothetical protein
MVLRGTRARRLAGAAALSLILPLAGCLPPRNASGEPLEPVPTHVKSVKIDPRTLKPFEEEGDDERPGGPEGTPSSE